MANNSLYERIKTADTALSELPNIPDVLREQVSLGLLTSNPQAFYQRRKEVTEPLSARYDEAVATISEYLAPGKTGSSEWKDIMEQLSPDNVKKLLNYIFWKRVGTKMTEEDVASFGEALSIPVDFKGIEQLLETSEE